MSISNSAKEFRLSIFLFFLIFVNSCTFSDVENHSLEASQTEDKIGVVDHSDSKYTQKTNRGEQTVFNRFYKVKFVVDGDTFWIDDGTKKGKKVRLIGIDAPESRKSQNKDVEYFGKEASNYLKNRLKGKKVKLVQDVSTTDRYQRILAYVYLEDGTFINEELLREGYARVFTFPPDVKYAQRFLKIQRQAQQQQKGLWKYSKE